MPIQISIDGVSLSKILYKIGRFRWLIKIFSDHLCLEDNIVFLCGYLMAIIKFVSPTKKILTYLIVC